MPYIEHNFLKLMIPHHASAIVMADEELMHGPNQRLIRASWAIQPGA